MERSDIRELTLKWKKDPHFAALNAGYVLVGVRHSCTLAFDR